MQPQNVDSTHVEDYTGLFTARIFLLFENASLLIRASDYEVSKIVYRPNVNVRIGIAGFWKWFGLGLSIDNPFYKTDRTAYGKTSTLDFRINAYGRALAGEIFLQRYKGYYLSFPEKPEGTHYIIPDMQTFSFGISGYWVYNSKRFSIRAAFIQNERQKKSAGSFMIRPSFLYYQISSSNGLIPAEMAYDYHIPVSNSIKRGEIYSVGLSPGYAYTLVFLKNFYLTAVVFPGVAAQFSSFGNDMTGTSESEFVFQLSGRFALGYNSSKWFLGGSVQTGFNEVPSQLSNARFYYDVAQFRIWGGTRFDIFKKKKARAAN